MVDALNGAPGLYSARYAGVDGDEADAKNREKLLAELANVPTERRQAKFVSTIVLLQHPSDPSPIIAQGECDGRLFMKKKVKMASVTIHSFLAQKKAVLLQN